MSANIYGTINISEAHNAPKTEGLENVKITGTPAVLIN